MIYLDYGATSFHKPQSVYRAVESAMRRCASPGRGGYPAAQQGAQAVFACRETAAELFGCRPEQVVLTSSCTHGLNIAVHSLVTPGAKVAVSGFEHNAVVRPLYALGAQLQVAGRRLFDWDDTLEQFRRALDGGVQAAVFTHVSNVFGYILPVEQMAAMCRERGVPFILDAAQSAGSLPVKLDALGAAFIAMPGHKGLLGPQGTGLLLCGGEAVPLLFGGTGSESLRRDMPGLLPERLEPGTLNVPGAAGLDAGMRHVLRRREAIAQALRPGIGGAGDAGLFRRAPGGHRFLCAGGGLRAGGGASGPPGHRPAGGAALRPPGPRKRRDAGNGDRPCQLWPRRRRLADGRPAGGGPGLRRLSRAGNAGRFPPARPLPNWAGGEK